jgi:phosphinothricin acetyltransferase
MVIHFTQADMTTIRAAHPADAAAIAAIYNHYVRTSTITFEEVEVTSAEIARRIDNVMTSGLPWLVLEDRDDILGYAYACKWKERSAYRRSVESSIYMNPSAVGKGYSRCLYQRLFEQLTQCGIHLVIGGVAQPNEASTVLHRKMGFEPVGSFREVGFKFGQWLDVSYWQLRLGV